jgi:hypothetical protein
MLLKVSPTSLCLPVTLQNLNWTPTNTNLLMEDGAPYAMGDSGEKVKIDPETFKILDGKLYLFYNFWGNNTLDDWKKNEKKIEG